MDLVRKLAGDFAANSAAIGIFHLSDEYCGCPIDFYAQAQFVIRNYYRPEAAGLTECLHVPLGYKRGFVKCIARKPITERRWRWFFAGEAKGNRIEMLAAAEAVSGGYAVTTSRWNDPAGLDTQAYAAALSDAVFALCPRGNDSVDCFRVYEALEAGAIPIVEDDGCFGEVCEWVHLPRGIRMWRPPRARIRYRKAFGPSYWLGMFGDEFPLPRVFNWRGLSEAIAGLNVAELSEMADSWWAEIKKLSCERVNKLGRQLVGRGQQSLMVRG